ESVGVAHVLQAAALGEGEATDERGHDIHDKHDPDAHDAHGHGHAHGSVTPHESPPSMWIPLAVLAVLATIGGLVGVGPAFKFITGSEHPGGRLNIVNWLDPVIWNPSTRQFGSEAHAEAGGHGAEASGASASSSHEAAGEAASAGGEHGTTPTAQGGEEHAEPPLPYSDTGYNMARTVSHSFGSHTAAEWFFVIVSLLVAGFGIFLGFLFYVWRPHLPDLWAGRLSTLYRASFNKYWVDELYGALVTRRTMDAARGVYAVDSKGIDGAVNGVAWLTRRLSSFTGATDRIVVDGAVNGVAGFIKLLMSPLLRAAQTGLTANYALVMILGLIASVGLFFGAEIWASVTSAIRNIFAFVL
ncbi:MAG: hypothetical protein H7Z38_02150, partial [Rubrivivax sp.]|nr:hypothetical protein [Pyrinomonadaceae bacterium]